MNNIALAYEECDVRPFTCATIACPGQAALILSGLIAVFLWTPLTSGGYYATVDLLQDFPLLHVGPAGYKPKNLVASDPVFQMWPFLNKVLPHRSQEIRLFSISCLAAVGVDLLTTRRHWHWPRLACRRYAVWLRAGAALLAGLALLVTALAGSYVMLGWAAQQPGSQVGSATANAVVLPHVGFLSFTFVVAVTCITGYLACSPYAGKRHLHDRADRGWYERGRAGIRPT